MLWLSGVESRPSANHPVAVIDAADARTRNRKGGYWRKQTLNRAIVNDRLWVGSGRGNMRRRRKILMLNSKQLRIAGGRKDRDDTEEIQ
jgi:hypothetical protein